MTLLLLSIYAVLMTVVAGVLYYLHFISNPLPFPDKGHRCYGVRNAEAQKVLIHLLHRYGLKEVFTMDAGPSHQTILNDGRTVIHFLEPEARGTIFTGTALSIRSNDPLCTAKFFEEILDGRGYRSEIHQPALGELSKDMLVVLKSEAFLGWELVITKPILQMPMPKRRKISSLRWQSLL